MSSKDPRAARSCVRSFSGPLLLVGLFAAVPTDARVSPVVPKTAGTSDVAKTKVVFFAPCLIFEKLQNESPLDPAKFQVEALVQRLSAAGEEYLRSKDYQVVPADEYKEAETTALIAKLKLSACRIARGSVTTEARANMAEFAGHTGPVLLFAELLRIRTGDKAYWSPLTGSLGASQSETLMTAALVDPSSGTVVWKNEILIRKVVKPDSKDNELDKTLGLLFANSSSVTAH